MCTCMCGGRGRGGVTYVAAPLVSPCVLAVKGLVTRHRLCVEHAARSRTGGRRACAGARVGGRGSGRVSVGEARGVVVGCSPPSMEHGTLERTSRGPSRRTHPVQEQHHAPCGATDHARERTSRGPSRRTHQVQGQHHAPCGATDHARERTSRGPYIAVRAAAADAPGPGAAPCTPQRDGSGAPTTRRLVPVMFFSSAPTGGSSAPSASSESMAPVTRTPRGDGVGCCRECAHSVTDFVTEFSFFNRIFAGDIKSWGQFSSLFIITVWYKARIATQCSYA